MNLSRASLYAIQGLLFIARRPPQESVSAYHVALAYGIPEGFLVKGLLSLVKVGILPSIKGPHGGYRLGRPPRQSPCWKWLRRWTARSADLWGSPGKMADR